MRLKANESCLFIRLSSEVRVFALFGSNRAGMEMIAAIIPSS